MPVLDAPQLRHADSGPGPSAMDERRRRFSTADFERLHRRGFFERDERVELVEGELIRMAPMGGPHVWVLVRLDEAFGAALAGTDHPILTQIPVELDESSQPQPDLMVLRPESRTEELRNIVAADALLVAEVSDSTLRYDLGPKARLYARSGIPEYWVVDVNVPRVVVHRDPSPSGYRSILEFRPPDSLSPLVLPTVRIDLAALLRGCGRSGDK